MILKQIKLSQQERNKLIKVKARTGIEAWNILCRWALCISLMDESIPFGPDVPSDSTLEMSWATFGGENQEIYDAIFRERCRKDGIADGPVEIGKYFRLHLQRGINALSAKNGPMNISEVLSIVQQTR